MSRSRQLFLLLPALAFTAAGCGSSGKTSGDAAAIRGVVTEFSTAHDARACNLLTDDALQSVYGGYTAPIPKSRANCVAAAKGFKGAPVHISQVNLVNSTTAKASAQNATNTIGYTITLRKNGGKRWRIDQITQAKVKQ